MKCIKNNFISFIRSIQLIIFIILLGYGTTKSQEITKQKKGYFNLTEFGYFDGRNIFKPIGSSAEYHYKYSVHAFSIRNINGWFFTNKFSLGVGIGLDAYSVKNNYYRNDNNCLIFADVRYYLKDNINTLFVYGNLGGSVALADYSSKGRLLNFGIGYKFRIAKSTAFNTSIGWNEQYTDKGQHIISEDGNVYSNRYSSVAFKVGFLF